MHLCWSLFNVLEKENLPASHHSDDPNFKDGDLGTLYFQMNFDNASPVMASALTRVGLHTIPNMQHSYFHIFTTKGVEPFRKV
jgi:hypothetical protein